MRVQCREAELTTQGYFVTTTVMVMYNIVAVKNTFLNLPLVKSILYFINKNPVLD